MACGLENSQNQTALNLKTSSTEEDIETCISYILEYKYCRKPVVGEVIVCSRCKEVTKYFTKILLNVIEKFVSESTSISHIYPEIARKFSLEKIVKEAVYSSMNSKLKPLVLQERKD